MHAGVKRGPRHARSAHICSNTTAPQSHTGNVRVCYTFLKTFDLSAARPHNAAGGRLSRTCCHVKGQQTDAASVPMLLPRVKNSGGGGK